MLIVFEFNLEHRVRQSFQYGSRYFNRFFFRHNYCAKSQRNDKLMMLLLFFDNFKLGRDAFRF